MRVLLLVACLILISGCSILPPLKTTPSSTYTIMQWPQNTAKKSTVKQGVVNKTLLVTTPIALPGYASSRMIYVTVPYQLRTFSDHFWVAPPAELLLPLIANHLQAMHYFQAVVTSPFTGSANVQLNTKLLTLQQEFLQPISQVRLVIEATLVNTTTGQVIASQLFTVIVKAPGDNPYSGVLATNEAANQVVRQIGAFVVKSVH
ncbi:MAG: ABC-type transport auxiliary lipoprotein family protein [Gammaproteobacteria bacterium]|nr:ABC-type transport auxiliary lipoprotein family protein [Gammaproteobacteria bacterium]